MKEELEKYILSGQYKEAKKICGKMSIEDAKNIMMDIAYDTESISVISFVQYMAYKIENTEWLELAVDIMINPLCFIEGAYSIALFFSRELLETKRNVENLERMLFFYDIPEKLITKEEAINIAKEILQIEPNNKIALEIKY